MSPELSDVIETITGSTRAMLSVGLLGVGVLLLLIGIVGGTSPGALGALLGIPRITAWTIAGFLAGIALPMMIIGVFVVLPATKTQRIGAAVGMGIATLGVLLFVVSFPHQWFGDTPDRSTMTTLLYSFGVLLTMVYLFLSVANLQTPTQGRRGRPTGGQYKTMSSQQPNTAKELVLGALALAFGSEAGVDDVEVAVDYEVVADALTEVMDDDITGEVSVTDDGDRLELRRKEEVAHARFTTALPRYVTVADRDGTDYEVTVDEDVYHLVTSN